MKNFHGPVTPTHCGYYKSPCLIGSFSTWTQGRNNCCLSLNSSLLRGTACN